MEWERWLIYGNGVWFLEAVCSFWERFLVSGVDVNFNSWKRFLISGNGFWFPGTFFSFWERFSVSGNDV